MSVETELKLQLEPDGMRRLRRHPLVLALKRGRPTTRLQKSVYFDTDDFRLRDLGVMLRVRHIGRRRIQGLKTVGDCLGGAWARQELETEITGDVPDYSQFHDTEWAALFADPGLTSGLRPVFCTEVRRSIYDLGGEDWTVELAIDEGQLVAAQGSAPILEAELELKSGDPKQLFELALKLHGDISARLLTASKSQRGYALVEGRRPSPQKAEPLALPLGCTAAQAFRFIARSCIGQILVNQDCLIETHDPEAVHQMRVALRRLRSGMNVFKDLLDTPQTAALKDELRWLAGLLGPARDTDVFIEEIVEPLAEVFGEEPGFIALRDAFHARKQALYDIAMGVMSQPRFTKLMLGLGAWSEGGDWIDSEDETRRALLDRPARALATETLEKRERKLAHRLKHLAKLPPHTRHLARIEVKRLRYSVEFFASLYPEHKAKKLSQALGVLQDRLGLLNDIAVSRVTLKEHGVETQNAERLWAAGMIAGWHAARVTGLLKQAAGDIKAYHRLPRFWRDDLGKPN